MIVQECAAGLVPIRQSADGLAFAAPPLIRAGAVDAALVDRIAAMLRIGRVAIVDSQWVDNGPGWVAVLLRDAEAVLAHAPYIASQGTVLGRRGRVHVSTDAENTIWVGGGTVTCVAGDVEL